MKERLSPQVLQEFMEYDGETGALTWRPRDRRHFETEASWKGFNTRCAGKPAITASSGKGYLQGTIYGVTYMAHRVAWAVFHSSWPQGEIDHINGIRSDNRIVNLRDVTRLENARNLCAIASDTGVRGVTWDRRLKRYRVHIYLEGKRKYIGCFPTIDEAAGVRKLHERHHGFHPLHGTRASDARKGSR